MVPPAALRSDTRAGGHHLMLQWAINIALVLMVAGAICQCSGQLAW